MACRIVPVLLLFFSIVLVQCKSMTFNQQKALSSSSAEARCSPSENQPLAIPDSITSAKQAAEVYLELLRRWKCAEQVQVKMWVQGSVQEVAYPSIAVDEWRPLLPQISSKLKAAVGRAKVGGFPDKKGQFVEEALRFDGSPKKKARL